MKVIQNQKSSNHQSSFPLWYYPNPYGFSHTEHYTKQNSLCKGFPKTFLSQQYKGKRAARVALIVGEGYLCSRRSDLHDKLHKEYDAASETVTEAT